MTINLTPIATYTYNDLINDALIDLKGTGKAAYGTTLMQKLCNDAVQIARKTIARKCPDMIQSSRPISLIAGNSGPYNISSDFETPLRLIDESGKEMEVVNSYRGEYNVVARRMRPDGNWIEGHAPAQMFFNATPQQAYAWTIYYIATVQRVSDFTQYVPLPVFTREPIAKWIVKFAANTQEYIASDEDQQIGLMESMMADILRLRRPAIKLRITGVGF
jgi:hypothetical protein